MATAAANKRLTREYKAISAKPPPYILARPSEANILEWHYLITGPEDTPYTGGQYWGTLMFPPEYPFKPPAIRMITPSGRFAPSTRLCLSISDFHPKSFNPSWDVSTILIGLLSFMTSEEMTTGSISTSITERKLLASRTRWWNSTGGGSAIRTPNPSSSTGYDITKTPYSRQTKWGLGDAGARFREQWPDIDVENWKWMDEKKVDLSSGGIKRDEPAVGDLLQARRRVGGQSATGAAEVARRGGGWITRYKIWVGLAVVIAYVVLARLFESAGEVQMEA